MVCPVAATLIPQLAPEKDPEVQMESPVRLPNWPRIGELGRFAGDVAAVVDAAAAGHRDDHGVVGAVVFGECSAHEAVDTVAGAVVPIACPQWAAVSMTLRCPE
jgi:hypothetical protein